MQELFSGQQSTIFLEWLEPAPGTRLSLESNSSLERGMGTLVFFCCLLSLTLAGCADAKQGAKAGSPPLEFSFRRSQIPTRGMVVGIKNASQSETLKGLTVEVRSADEETTRSHLIEKEIKPRDSITVGWIELDGWTLKPGDEVSVTSDNYTDPKAVTVPEP